MGRFLLPRGNDRLRAAQIVGNAKLGGVVSSILNYYSHIDRTRWRFDFFTYGPSSLDEKLKELDSEARVIYIPRLDTQFYKAVPCLARELKKGGYAVVAACKNSRYVNYDIEDAIAFAEPKGSYALDCLYELKKLSNEID